ncbi:Zinc finger protein 862 [Frankliniella fusca]|uniref:Zinc finger protein 862 n=1 Tax=Frankliniella fusca TaxID=407009 RepID=A0AAE1HPE1_9NEOP|nr:Zinc finger protein 862 [Frankliniella fusca]KAK3924376.1 Zinc finger protein 862 [Frankliniella fusca]
MKTLQPRCKLTARVFILQLTTLVADLNELIVSLAGKFLKPEKVPRLRPGEVLTDDAVKDLRQDLRDAAALVPISSADFGAGVRIWLGQVRLDPTVLKNVQTRCVRYLAVLVQNLLDILPEQTPRLMSVKHFTPSEVLRVAGRADILDLPIHLAEQEDVDDLKKEWERLARVDWGAFFDGNIPKTSVEFWQGVVDYDRLGAEQKFGKISALAFRALSAPLANADVERAFSFMNCIKTKKRNSMSPKLLEAIMRVRMRMTKSGCCKAFEPWPAMLAKFTSDMYTYERRPVGGDGRAGGLEADEDGGWEEITLCALEEDGVEVYDM